MASQIALAAPRQRPVHPLAAWRRTQRVQAGRGKPVKTMSVAEAVRRFSAFIGRDVPYQTWTAWEKYEDEPGFRDPSRFFKMQLFLFTGGAIRPDHFHPISEWRGILADARLLDAAAPLAAGTAGGARERGARPALAETGG